MSTAIPCPKCSSPHLCEADDICHRAHVEPDILEEALEITNAARQAEYGPPEQNFARVAALWSPILGKTITPKDVALCMIALKVARACHSAKRDTWVDIAGYARCGSIVEAKEPPAK